MNETDKLKTSRENEAASSGLELEHAQVSGCPERGLGTVTKVVIGVVAVGAAAAAAYAGGLFDSFYGDKNDKKKATKASPSAEKTPQQSVPAKVQDNAPPTPRAQGPVNLPSSSKNPLAGLLSMAGSTVGKVLSVAEPPIAGAGDEQTTQAAPPGGETPEHVFLFPESPPSGGPPPFVPQPSAPPQAAKHPATKKVKAPDVTNPRAGHDDAAAPPADPLAALLTPIVQQLTTLGKKVDALATPKAAPPPPAKTPAAKPPAKSPSAPLLSLLGGALGDVGISGVSKDDEPEEAGA